METRTYRGKDISLLGFGLMRLPRLPGKTFDIDEEEASRMVDRAIAKGVNYFDTAYTYGGSETFAGLALAKHPRESYNLATKCPPWMVKDAGDFERIFREQTERCKTDYFDFYLVHNLAKEATRAAGNEEYFVNFGKIGMYDMLRRKKEEGKIRHIGFSFHGTLSLLERLIDRYEWDFAQIQLNYIDWQAYDAGRQYELLTEHSIPVVLMEPLRGGALATLNEESAGLLKRAQPEASLASWGIRYAASLPNVITVLSGMSTMGQLEDNVATMDSFKPVSDAEKALLEQAAEIYSRSGFVPCTGCRYCLPCPEGVDIPRIFSIYNHYRMVRYRIPFDNGYSTLEEKEKASNCARCGACSDRCPQHIDIPGYMREIDEFAQGKE